MMDAYLAAAIAGCFLTLLFLVARAERYHGGMLMISLVWWPLLILSVILFVILLYRVWVFVINAASHKQISLKIRSPGKAAGFLFIPVFHIYWMFYSWVTLARSLNELARAHQLSGRIPVALPVSLGIAICVGYLPGLGMVLGSVAGCVLQVLFVCLLIGLSRRIAAAAQGSSIPSGGRDLSHVQDYRALFDRANYGINYYAGAAFVLAFTLSPLMLPAWMSLIYGTRSPVLTTQTLLFLFTVGCGGGVVWVAMSHLLKQRWSLLLAAGVAGAVINALVNIVPGWVRGYLSDVSLTLVGDMAAQGFVTGAAFVGFLMAAVRIWGLRWWSLPAGLSAKTLIGFFIIRRPFLHMLSEGFPYAWLISDLVAAFISGVLLYAAFILYFDHPAGGKEAVSLG
jgi:hypothetical protein